jgi:hypothetical protein
MKPSRASIGVLFVVIGLVGAPSLATAQDSSRPDLKRVVEPKGGKDFDFAAKRADADAKAKAYQDTDVKNKQGQKQAAVGLGLGVGKVDVGVKNKSANTNNNALSNTTNNTLTNTNTFNNTNSLTTGDIYNQNVNQNKQIQSFGFPSFPSRDAIKPR